MMYLLFILGTFVIRHFSGLCISYDDDTSKLKLTLACGDKFKWHGGRHLEHVRSGKCVISESDNYNLTLSGDCSGTSGIFEHLRHDYSIKHISTGKCIHPSGGHPYPSPGTKTILWTGCIKKVTRKLEFRLIKEGKS